MAEKASTGWTLEDLKNLEAAIAQGAMIVQYTDKRIQYRSLDEMVETRNLIRKSLGLSKQRTKRFATFSKGLLDRCNWRDGWER